MVKRHESTTLIGKKRLVLIDGHSLLFRAFHAYPALTTGSGELVNAVYGFTNILLGVIRDLTPTHIAVSFDRAEPTFRHKQYKGYKAHRPEAPEDLLAQLNRVGEVVSVLNIPSFSVAGFEADDVIGTLAEQARKSEIRNPKSEIIIVTGDQDAFQLVRDPSGSSGQARILVYTPARAKLQSKLWDENAVKEKYALLPRQLIDYKALAGDSSDEIPGVRGVGPKSATRLLQVFGTLEKVYHSLDQVRGQFGPTLHRKLVDGNESAFLSKKLATIVTDVPIRLSLRDCEVHDYDKTRAVEKLRELDFSSLIPKLPNDGFEQMVQEEMFR